MSTMAEVLAAHSIVWPHKPTGLRLSCKCGEVLDDFDPMEMTAYERLAAHQEYVLAEAGFGSMSEAWLEGAEATFAMLLPEGDATAYDLSHNPYGSVL